MIKVEYRQNATSKMSIHRVVDFCFFAEPLVCVSSSCSALRLALTRELRRAPSRGVAFFDLLVLLDESLALAFLLLLALGFSVAVLESEEPFCADSEALLTSSDCLAAVFGSGAPFFGSFLDPGSFS